MTAPEPSSGRYWRPAPIGANQPTQPITLPPEPDWLPPGFLRPLPCDTRARVAECYEITIKPDRQGRNQWTAIVINPSVEGESLNPGLFLNKFCPDVQLFKERRALFLAGWATMANKQSSAPATALLKRRESLMQTRGAGAWTWSGSVAWRLIVGLGNPNPWETNLTLHPLYGVPILPGSALKGLTRQWRLWHIGSELGIYPMSAMEQTGRQVASPLRLLEALLLSNLYSRNKTEQQMAAERAKYEEALQHLLSDSLVQTWMKDMPVPRPLAEETANSLEQDFGREFREIFGATDAQGKVTFEDALPLPEWKYEVEVMTPHFQDYYGDKQDLIPPADWLEPNPITFLTVGQGSQFRFDLYSTNSALSDRAGEWLEAALSEWGIGGKTRAGYGEIQETL